MKQERQAKPLKKVQSGLPQIEQNGFNQTIIINNPNININYIENQPGSKAKNNKTIIETTLYNQKNDSKGIDTWNLNKNLKQFSETRQLGFFNGRNAQPKHKTPSPYLVTKSKTQDIRNNVKTINQVNSFREHKTIKKQTLIPIEKDSEHHESKTTFRTKQYAYKKAKNPQEGSNYNLQLYSNTKINEPKKPAAKEKSQITSQRRNPTLQLRKNRFERIQTPSNSSEEERNKLEGMDERLRNKEEQGKSPRRVIQKSIEKVSKCLLKRVDNYFDNIESVDIPSSKIQQYTTTISQPTAHRNTLEYRSSLAADPETYDFEFEDEKPRRRPKTPYKRKKLYEQL